MGLLAGPARHVGHLGDVLAVGVVVLGLLLVRQLADVVGRLLGVQAGHAGRAVIGHLLGRPGTDRHRERERERERERFKKFSKND